MLFWRVSLPFLKFIVPLPALARFMASDRISDGRGRNERELVVLRQILIYGGRLFVSPNCFERSLLVFRILSHAGASPNLVVGVSRRDAGIAGHAWVEVDGRPVRDCETPSYQRVATFDQTGHLLPAVEF
jgi:hypothetical protein